MIARLHPTESAQFSKDSQPISLEECMKALEVAGTVNEQGQLLIDEPLAVNQTSRVRIIILFSEDSNEQNEKDLEPASTGFRQGWQDAMTGNTIPVTQLWDRLDAN